MEPDQSFVKPGYGFIPDDGIRLWTVLGSGIAVTLYHERGQVGGMCHYYKPYRLPYYPSTSAFAAPAILWLLGQFEHQGMPSEELEAQVIGGASNPDHPNFHQDIAEQNVAVGVDILNRKRVRIDHMEVGGSRGRKVVFNAKTGETAIARVSHIRNEDWYPQLGSGSTD